MGDEEHIKKQTYPPVCQGDGDGEGEALWDSHHHDGHPKDEVGQRPLDDLVHRKALIHGQPPASQTEACMSHSPSSMQKKFRSQPA